MMVISKRTCSTVVFAVLCLVLLLTGNYSYSSVKNNDDVDEIARLYERRQVAEAITKIYKHVHPQEAIRIVDTAYLYSEEYNIEPSLAIGVMAAESGFNGNAKSKEGAKGYTQVQAKYHKDKIKGRNIFDTKVNIEVGLTILSDCLKKNDTLQKGLGCYNGTNDTGKIKKFHKAIRSKRDQIFYVASL